MYFTIERKKIYDALNNLQNITNKKGTLAVLLNVLLETTTDGIILTGTNLEIGLQIFIPAKIKEKGKITLPSKKLFEIIRESQTDEIIFQEKENSWIHIKIGLSNYNLAGIPADEFPKFPEYNNDNFAEIDASILQSLIEKTLYATAGEQENIYTLNSILFEKDNKNGKNILKMISSDGHRLSLMEKETSIEIEKLTTPKIVLIPKKGVQEIKKFCETKENIDISFQEKQFILKDEKSIMVIQLKNGEFPNYKAIINSVHCKNFIKVERIPLLESLRRINLFTDDEFHTISLELNKEKILLSSQSMQFGNAKDEISIDYSGEQLKLGFNCQYFIETLQVMDCQYINIYISSDSSPCLIKSPEETGFISIIMPMQIP